MYVNKLRESNLQDLTEIYDAIYRDHKDGLKYTFSEEALCLYDQFDLEICQMLNSKWSMGVLVKDDAELGKDRRQVIRLAVILYVLYMYTRRALFQSYGTVSRVVGKKYMEYAINLMRDYFRVQKRTIDKVFKFQYRHYHNMGYHSRGVLPESDMHMYIDVLYHF